MNPRRPPSLLDDAFIAEIIAALESDGRVRRKLPGGGRIHVDRLLPFVCVYRRPVDATGKATERIVTSEASFIVAPAERRYHAGLKRLLAALSKNLSEAFGAVLVLEVWASEWLPTPPDPDPVPEDFRPAFRIHTYRGEDVDRFLDSFEQALSRIRLRKQRARVEIVRSRRVGPPGAPQVLSGAQAGTDVRIVGLEVAPVYLDRQSGEPYPILLRQLLSPLTKALRVAFFDFARSCTTHRPGHFLVLGRRRLAKAVWEVDRRLAEVAESFDFLLQVTPLNLEQAWRTFKRRGFEKAPVFHYRPSPVDPVVLKRQLWDTPVLRLEDPALTYLFRQKQDELDRQLDMLLDLDTRRFLYGSLQLYGPLPADLVATARQLLAALPPRTRDELVGDAMGAEEFASIARDRLRRLDHGLPDVELDVQVRDDIGSGLMVSANHLLVSRHGMFPRARVEALLCHEVGTHLLTWCNGRSQPFRQLACGLAGYEAMQEGIAVLAEFLAGGLTRPRLRLLAARVLAVQSLLDGASIVDSFRLLHDEHGMTNRAAFRVAARVHRGGGLTKDAIYLQGLQQVLGHVRNGGDLRLLYVGKIATDHLSMIHELEVRGVLRAAPLRPWYLDTPEGQRRLARIRSSSDLLDLVRRN